ncbi:MAG: Ni/Fe-hydrogenase, b-type cytochrome subunit, partial [Calditrichia bacterium]
MVNETRAEFYEIYVWEWPVRLFHWVNALCVIVLAITGFLIGNPLGIISAGEAHSQYWFGNIRFFHFAFAYIWVFNSIVRLYWGFVGNEYVKYSSIVPFKKQQWREILNVVRMDVLQLREHAYHTIGHNALAGLTYTIGFLAFLFQTITGFGLYAAMSNNWIANAFAWVVPLMGGDHIVRLWHHVFLWFFVIIFVPIHLYIAAYHDYVG